MFDGIKLLKIVALSSIYSLLTLGYLYYAESKGGYLPYRNLMPFFVILAYIIADSILLSININKFLLGGILGLLLSLIGRFYLDLPTQLFKLENPAIVHPTAIIMYSLYFGLVIDPINKMVL